MKKILSYLRQKLSNPLIEAVAIIGLVLLFEFILTGKITLEYTIKVFVMIGFFVLFQKFLGKPKSMDCSDIQDIYKEASETIEQFLNKNVSDKKWNEFLNRGMNGNAKYMELQRVLAEIPTHYPPTETEHYCSPRGKEKMLKIAELIKQEGWKLEELK